MATINPIPTPANVPASWMADMEQIVANQVTAPAEPSMPTSMPLAVAPPDPLKPKPNTTKNVLFYGGTLVGTFVVAFVILCLIQPPLCEVSDTTHGPAGAPVFRSGRAAIGALIATGIVGVLMISIAVYKKHKI